MSTNLNRRQFLSASVIASSAAVTVTDAGKLAAETVESEPGSNVKTVVPCCKGQMPMGKIGNLTLSRLISGGNLISGWAHSRDLHYVPSLMRAYNTEEKVMDTLQLLEEHGVNAIIADPAKKPMAIFGRYWKERGGRMQWIAEGHPDLDDWRTNIQASIDFGAAAVYVQGVIGDQWYNQGKVELLGNCVDFVRSQKVPAGIGAHKLEVLIAAEKLGLGAEFYVKTLHHGNYWSARRPGQDSDVVENREDNYWEMTPDRTIAFMQEIEKPWIAFKVLAAGGIRPESGFRYAFEHGADFICVGMFDFQVEQNVALVRKLVPEWANRSRDWMA